MSHRLKARPWTALACAAAVVFASPAFGHDWSAAALAPGSWLDPPGLLGDNPLFSQGRPVVLLPNHGHSADNTDWLRSETDACGDLQQMQDRRSIVKQTAFDDGLDGPDEDDPAYQGRLLFQRWLSDHAEVAVISDGVDKSCDGFWFDGDGDEDTLEIA
jgi:hypothetical protein